MAITNNLTLRAQKGSPLTITEMDGNLIYLENKVNNAAKAFKKSIGEIYGGGVVFHSRFDQNGDEIVYILDPQILNGGNALAWANITATQLSGTTFFDGYANTQIITANTTTSAALICTQSTNGGFNDWYLPAIGEFDLIGSNIGIIDDAISSVNGYNLRPNEKYTSSNLSNTFWSSSEANFFESDHYYAYVFQSITNNSNFARKNITNTMRVRAIRKVII
jgi:hypothetical protein